MGFDAQGKRGAEGIYGPPPHPTGRAAHAQRSTGSASEALPRSCCWARNAPALR